MSENKKKWISPSLTKVELNFDKEMTGNCFTSGKTPAANNRGCGAGSTGTCWTNNKPPRK